MSIEFSEEMPSDYGSTASSEWDDFYRKGFKRIERQRKVRNHLKIASLCLTVALTLAADKLSPAFDGSISIEPSQIVKMLVPQRLAPRETPHGSCLYMVDIRTKTSICRPLPF